MPSMFAKERIVARPGFNRWLVPPASVAIHLCIGSVYAWSIFNPPLTRLRGVVTSGAADWSLSQVVWVFTVAIVCLGLSAAVAGKWLERVGPRVVGTVAAFCWGGGFLTAAVGIEMRQLWLLYLGYGVIGGCGLGLGYVSPVSTLVRWFPDRRGMAAGLAIMGFGGGAMLGAPAMEHLIRLFYQAPVFVGAADAVTLVNRDGRLYAEHNGQLQEVVVAAAADVPRMIVPGPPGVYLTETGRTGVAETFVVLGLVYLAVMLCAAFSYRIPPPGWKPAGWTPPTAARSLISTRDVGVDQALRTPQFWLLWVVLCFNVTAGIGVLGVAKTMMSDLFGAALPHIVDSTFANTYVLMASLFNMLGRFFWASASDWLGRKQTYSIFFVAGSVLYVSIPFIAWQAGVSPGVTWLVLFYAVTMLIFTMYGGGFASIPAYLADLFGARYVGGIHGRLLTAWSAAGVLGPWAITALREGAVWQALGDLSALVDPARFAARFGAPPAEWETLARQNTLTLSALMELTPAGTVDPACTLYNDTMFLMAGLLMAALVANLLVRPVHAQHWLPEEAP